MTKVEIIKQLAAKTGTTGAGAERSLNALLDIIAAALARGEKVVLTGFGSFEVRQRAARMGRNPQTGAPLHIQATKSPAFKAGKALKEAVRG